VERWKAPSRFYGLVEPLPQDIKALVPSFHYHLVDLSEHCRGQVPRDNRGGKDGFRVLRGSLSADRWSLDAEFAVLCTVRSAVTRVF